MEERIKNSICRILVKKNSEIRSRGTGFLINKNFALTAFHVIAEVDDKHNVILLGDIELIFPKNRRVKVAGLQEYDPDFDWAIVKLEENVETEIIPAIRLEIEDIPWKSYGFPGKKPDGMICSGKIDAHNGIYHGATAIQLSCTQTGSGYGWHPTGLSGGPCLVKDTNGEYYVVGIMRSSLIAGVLYACPISFVNGTNKESLINFVSTPQDLDKIIPNNSKITNIPKHNEPSLKFRDLNPKERINLAIDCMKALRDQENVDLSVEQSDVDPVFITKSPNLKAYCVNVIKYLYNRSKLESWLFILQEDFPNLNFEKWINDLRIES